MRGGEEEGQPFDRLRVVGLGGGVAVQRPCGAWLRASPKIATHPSPHVRHLRPLPRAIKQPEQLACGEFCAERALCDGGGVGGVEVGAGAAGADAGGGGDRSFGAAVERPTGEGVVLKPKLQPVGAAGVGERAGAAFLIGAGTRWAAEGEGGEGLRLGRTEGDRAGAAGGGIEQAQALGFDRQRGRGGRGGVTAAGPGGGGSRLFAVRRRRGGGVGFAARRAGGEGGDEQQRGADGDRGIGRDGDGGWGAVVISEARLAG